MMFTLELKNLPFEKLKNQVIYTEGEYNEDVNRYIQKNYDAIKAKFKESCLEFIYLPKLMEELGDEVVLKYNAPYAERLRDDVNVSSDFMLQFLVDPKDKKDFAPSLIYFYCEDYSNDKVFIYKGVDLNSGSGYRKTNDLSNILSFMKSDEYEEYCESALPKRYIKRKKSEENFDSETMAMIEEWKAKTEQLKKVGVSEYLLSQWVYGEVKLSRLHISKDYRIFLTDYGNMEVDIMPLPKTLFFLYLRHPEGIRFKDLIDYYDELIEIYKAVKLGFYNIQEARESMKLLCDSTKNSASEKSFYVRKCFGDVFKEHIAKNYTIEGPQAETKRIALPRDLVTWDKPI